MGLGQAIGHVVDAAVSATDNNPTTNPLDDIKLAAIEVALPKLDAIDTIDIAKYSFESAYEHIAAAAEKEQEEQDRIEQERNLYQVASIQETPIKEEFNPFKEQEMKKSYTAIDYAEMREALRNAGIKENESILTEQDIETHLNKKQSA